MVDNFFKSGSTSLSISFKVLLILFSFSPKYLIHLIIDFSSNLSFKKGSKPNKQLEVCLWIVLIRKAGLTLDLFLYKILSLIFKI